MDLKKQEIVDYDIRFLDLKKIFQSLPEIIYTSWQLKDNGLECTIIYNKWFEDNYIYELSKHDLYYKNDKIIKITWNKEPPIYRKNFLNLA